MIQFQLFGIPIRIEPWFWLTAFFLSGGTRLGAASGSTRADVVWVLAWMIVICFSVIVHELGHALTARKLAGGRNHIRLWAFGGLAYQEESRPSRSARLWTIAMGPGAGFLLFLLTVLAMILALGPQLASEVIPFKLFGIFPQGGNYSFEFASYINENGPALRLFHVLLLVNFWWSVINLLPIFPLDGGQLLSTWTGKTLLTYKVGFVVALIAAIATLTFNKSIWNACLFGFLAYQNFKNLQTFQGSDQWR